MISPPGLVNASMMWRIASAEPFVRTISSLVIPSSAASFL